MGQYIGIVGSIASILALFFVDEDHPAIRRTGFIIGLLAVAIAIIFEIKQYLKNKPLKFDKQGNRDYMERIISNEGEVIVFAADLTWVDTDRIKKTLIDKKGDLTLCVKKGAPYIEEFVKAGAHVYTYDDMGSFSPMTRFTIIRPDTATETVAITFLADNHNKEKRIIYEISNKNGDFQSSWIKCAAHDLYHLTTMIGNEQRCI